jgi:hypothetical protein
LHNDNDKSHAYKIIDRVFENRVLRKIFEPKRDEASGGRRKLHNEELNNLYSSPYITRMIRSRRMRWAGYAESMGRRRMHASSCVSQA